MLKSSLIPIPSASPDPIKSMSQFLAAVEKKSDRPVIIFRGQKSETMNLIPRLFRPADNIQPVTEVDDIEQGWIVKTCLKHEKESLEKFEKHAVPFLKTHPENKLEWIALAQHHGLPTRLLDWTEDPLVALFFALEESHGEKEESCNSVVWAFETFPLNADTPQTLEELDKIADQQSYHVYFPRHTSERILAQKGCFTVHGSGSWELTPIETDHPYVDKYQRVQIRKIVIPAVAKPRLREELHTLGINYFTLFPDLDGLCTQLNREFKTAFSRNSGD